MAEDSIIVVSGLPRSGTSLMMQMLQSGGIKLLTDNTRAADENNPRGYWEYGAVKNLPNENSFLEKAQGKAVKVISHLLPYLPSGYIYHILFMRRNLDEIILSQNKMLKSLKAKTDGEKPEDIKTALLRHLQTVHFWLQDQKNIRFLYIDHHSIITGPEAEAKRIAAFLHRDLNIPAMAAAIDPSLYRAISR